MVAAIASHKAGKTARSGAEKDCGISWDGFFETNARANTFQKETNVVACIFANFQNTPWLQHVVLAMDEDHVANYGKPWQTQSHPIPDLIGAGFPTTFRTSC
jgi:hypothetical protein